MHGVMEPIQRETGDLQDEDVIVGLLGITHLQKKKSDVDIALDMIEEEAIPNEESHEMDEDEDYELLFGRKRQSPSEKEPEKPSKMSRKAIRVING